ncbi:NF-X1-type zinc finger protein nfxl1 [Chamberlinius hualienensis]
MAWQGQRRGLTTYEETCIKIRDSNKKILANNEELFSDEDDDDAEVSGDVIAKILQSYSADGDSESLDLRRTKQFLHDAIQSGTNMCLICICLIKKTDAIWNCKGCHGSFHFQCLQKWAGDSIREKELNTSFQHIDVLKWFCPKCRYEYRKENIPTKYFCYCGQVENPSFDPWLVPHSCGNVCGRALAPECGHRCNILCHPGPCPPCPQMVMFKCHCGREKPRMRRCSARFWSCNQNCNRLLSCKQHKCQEKCHTGNCPTCVKRSVQPCFCGNRKEERNCEAAAWQCEKACGKPLSCGFHKCEIICHSGKCGDCPKTKIRSCPCGKQSCTLPCNEDIPTCGDTCGKLLACKTHKCAQRCHFGECGACLQMRTRKCRCGQKEKSMPCHKEFVCETKCKKVRDCGRHPCSRKCCSGDCPPCEQQCGRSLGCGNHKCNSRCHTGPCYPCPLMVPHKCFCGQTAVEFPCSQKNVQPPRCNYQCQVPPRCHHAKIQNHRCHFGNCPQCKLVCNKELSCEHSCPSKCHAAVPTKIETVQKRAGPWEPAIGPRIEIICKPCPPCQVPISVMCLGQHEAQDRPCSISKTSFSCIRDCGRKLPCGNHKCQLNCHLVSNPADSKVAGDNCEKCELPCSLKRPPGCPHSCVRLCHPKPCPPCRLMIQQRCHCQTSLLYVDCYKWTAANSSEKIDLVSCGDRCSKLMDCGHRCFSRCHVGPCTDSDGCKKKVVVRCKCKRLKQEFPCNLLRKGDVEVNCDAECQQLIEEEKKRKSEAAAKLEREEQEKNTRELEKFQRKMDRKKRKHKKSKEVEEEKSSFWKDYKLVMVITLIIAAVAFIFAYFMR